MVLLGLRYTTALMNSAVVCQAERGEARTALWSHVRVIVVVTALPPETPSQPRWGVSPEGGGFQIERGQPGGGS